MAQSTLPVLPPSEFPQFYTGELIDRLVALANTAVTSSELSLLCCGESSESSYGACDAIPCRKTATVNDIESGLDYCLDHFEGVILG